MYYPKSQIQTNLYTDGNELVYESTYGNYKGFYYKTSNGSFFSGKTPEDSTSQRLVIPQQSPQRNGIINPNLPPNSNQVDLLPIEPPKVQYTLSQDYIKSSKFSFNENISAPVNHTVYPTEKDYERGNFTRYYVKKVNSPLIKELPKKIYNRYVNKDKYVQYDLYIPFKFVWTITGKDEKEVANLNYKTLQFTENGYGITGLVNYFKNKLTEYYKKVD